MWREEGWRGFLRGNGTNCVRIIPYSACQFAAYTTYKRVSNPPTHIHTAGEIETVAFFGVFVCVCVEVASSC